MFAGNRGWSEGVANKGHEETLGGNGMSLSVLIMAVLTNPCGYVKFPELPNEKNEFYSV